EQKLPCRATKRNTLEQRRAVARTTLTAPNALEKRYFRNALSYKETLGKSILLMQSIDCDNI
ncbi:MAG TPA: hypothetical protein VK051_01985, partial [Paenalcaligenes sp.]|nr:hypothetical protein [Paenalcaligenes sp.]